jgi:hypothetical protein
MEEEEAMIHIEIKNIRFCLGKTEGESDAIYIDRNQAKKY